MSSLKLQSQAFLKRIGLYERAKTSRLYDLYWSIADRRILEHRAGELAFYRSLLKEFRSGDLIFDVGANHGSKTDLFLRLGAKVVAVEPDKSNQTILQQRFLSHRLRAQPVTVVGKAASDQNSVDTMWVDTPGSAKNTLSQKWVDALRDDKQRFGQPLPFATRTEVETTTLERLITTHGVPLFVKIDVEGFEPRVLRGLQRPLPYISFEVNLPEFRPEGSECVALLHRLAAKGRFNYSASLRHGLAFERWLSAQDFSRELDACTEPSIEVFWTTV